MTENGKKRLRAAFFKALGPNAATFTPSTTGAA